jgi:hypothetical protein
MFTGFNAATLALLLMTGWLGVFRNIGRTESNLPLIYYGLVMSHLQTFEYGYHPNWVWFGLVCALFLRFEFLGKTFLRAFHILEGLFLFYMVYRSLGMLMMW